MPEKTSDENTVKDAEFVANKFGIFALLLLTLIIGGIGVIRATE